MKIFSFLIALVLAAFLIGKYSDYKAPSDLKVKEQASESVAANAAERPVKISFHGAVKIPDSVYENTANSDTYYEIIHGNRKMIFWVYADCPIGRNIKSRMEAILNRNNLYSNYTHKPNLMSGGVMVRCRNNTAKCAQIYLYDNCSDNICVINPMEKAIIKLNNSDFDTIENTLIRAKNW